MKAFFKGFQNGLKEFGKKVSIIVNTALLLAVYILGVGIPALVARVKHKEFMHERLERKKSTYWEDISYSPKRGPYYKQY